MHGACAHAVPELRHLGRAGEVGRVLGNHPNVRRALAQVAWLPLETFVQGAGHARIGLRIRVGFALLRAVDTDAAVATAPLGAGKAVLTERAHQHR